jgi:hypothetical protein
MNSLMESPSLEEGERVRIFKKAAVAGLCSFAMAIGTSLPAHASLAHPAVVSEDPADTTPHIVLSDTDYDVRAFAEVGRTIFAGGLFTQVQDPAKTTTYERQNFVAFDSQTGVISPLNLSFNGTVGAIEPTPDGTGIYVAGAFSSVNGITRRGIMKYDLVNDRIDPVFAPTGMRTVHDLELWNGALIAAGNFTKKVMALDLTTGADTGAIDISVTGVVNTADETRVRHIAVSPDGTRLVATGNFTTVNGQARSRAFMLNLGTTATLSTWYAPRFAANCPAGGSRREWAQGVDFSPDGSYFVIVTTGGPNGTATGLCDAAARFETANVSSTAQPTWINWTGGDTLYSVAITGVAVYVGGHQRWLDNPFGRDSAGAGSVSRPGIGAIDPVTGRALPWNPTKSREHGTMALYATPSGLWVGSDGARFGHEDHAGIGFAPLNAGPVDTTPPNTFIDSGPSGNVSNTTATFTFSANEPSTFQCRLDNTGAFEPCESPKTYTNLSAGEHTFQVAAIDGSLNLDQTQAERTWNVVGPSSELIGNPGFEVDTSGWKGDAAANTLSRVAGGHSGAWAAQISTSQAGGNCGLDDQPSWVSFTLAGDYTASIWARSDTPGLTLKLRIREFVSGVKQGTVTESMPLTSSWQQVIAEYTPVAPGQSSLDYEAFSSNTPAGVCFLADDASITLGSTTDTTPPDTFIDSGPSGSVTDTSATFTFSASEPSTFQCSLDDGTFAACTSPVTYTNLSLGPHAFQVVATDESVNADPSPAQASWSVVEQSAELVGNPGFEVNTSGWKGDAASNTLTRVAGGHSGGWAAEVSNSQAGVNCGLDDQPSWVSSTQSGSYTVSMWARSDTPGRTLKLRVREYVGGAKQGTATENLALTSSWQQVTLVYTPVAPGSSLDVDAFISNAPVGVCFRADDVSITH